jgi:uncharacterized membrane protein
MLGDGTRPDGSPVWEYQNHQAIASTCGRKPLGLSILAVGLTAYLTVAHCTDPTALACPDSGIIICTAVTTGQWSVIFGVPVALRGLLRQRV